MLVTNGKARVTFTVKFTNQSTHYFEKVQRNVKNKAWLVQLIMPVPVAARSKAWVCSRSPAEIVGSNPTGGMDVCLLWVLCVVRYRSLRRADHSPRGVLQTVLRRCVWSRNLVNEEVLARVGPQRHRKKQLIISVTSVAPHSLGKNLMVLDLNIGKFMQGNVRLSGHDTL